MGRPTAAALVLAATALMVLAPSAASAAPAPGDLWSEFPLEPPAATTRAETVPTPAQVVEQPARSQAEGSGVDERTAGFLILLGAIVAFVAGFAGRRRGARRQREGVETEQQREPAVVRFERPVPAGFAGRAGSVTVTNRTTTFAAPRTAPTLNETLSPQARLADQPRLDDQSRLADQLDERESHADPETHQVCEIACWRGYVKWQFYVGSEGPLKPSFSSPYFRAPGKGAPEQSPAALQAHAVLVERLVAAGWEPEGYGEDWFSERFQRATTDRD